MRYCLNIHYFRFQEKLESRLDQYLPVALIRELFVLRATGGSDQIIYRWFSTPTIVNSILCSNLYVLILQHFLGTKE